MKIISLQAENIKRLSAVHIEPSGALVVIGGKNAAGKTSVLDSIAMALGGKGAVPPKPIRRGASKAEIVADLGELVVKRSFTKKGTYLSIETADGHKPKAPQKILDELVGTLSFDPLEFSRMETKDQSKVLRELVGLDFTKIDASRKKVFDERTILNRDVKALNARLEAAPHHEGAPKEEVSITELAAEAARRADHNKKKIFRANEVDGARADVERCQERIAELALQIQSHKDELSGLQEELQRAEKDLAEFQPEDESAVRVQMAMAEASNRTVRENAQREEIAAECRLTSTKADQYTEELEVLDIQKKDRLAAANMPVDGLGLDEEGEVIFNGLPFEQCSGAEKLRISVAIGLAMNPKLPVLLIRDGSLLDENSLRLLGEMAEAASAQVWIERVSDDGHCSVIIEDGHVREEK